MARLLENGKKSCIKCNALTDTCGCPDEVSQLDVYVEEKVVTVTQQDLEYPFCSIEVTKPGKYLRVFTIRRIPPGESPYAYGHQESSSEYKPFLTLVH